MRSPVRPRNGVTGACRDGGGREACAKGFEVKSKRQNNEKKLPARDCETESPPRHPQGGELRAAPYHAALERVESTGGSVEEAPKTKTQTEHTAWPASGSVNTVPEPQPKQGPRKLILRSVSAHASACLNSGESLSGGA